MQDLRDHGRPRRDVFSLCVSLEFCVVLQDTQAEAAVRNGGSSQVSPSGNDETEGLGDVREQSFCDLWSCGLVLLSWVVVHPQKDVY